jgi:predicted transcriptional regulator
MVKEAEAHSARERSSYDRSAAQALAATAPAHTREKLLAAIAEGLRQSHPGTVVTFQNQEGQP